MIKDCINQQKLDELFPATISDKFFDAIYGDVEEGAYDIVLTCKGIAENEADFAFELRRRANKCLKCSLTYGLPDVFRKHPLLNIDALAHKLGEMLGWKDVNWKLLPVEEVNDDLHVIPMILMPQKSIQTI